MITKEDIIRIQSKSKKDLVLDWHSSGIDKPPIKIFGKSKKLMLMTLAIIQSPINTIKCKVTGKKIPRDCNRLPLKIKL
jgi:hypothetical protein